MRKMTNEAYTGAGSQWLTPADKADIKETARSRALRRVEEREHLRLELKARQDIARCYEIAQTLHHGYEMRVDTDGKEVIVELSRSRVQALKAAADISFRMLDRVLPPLKAVEVNDSPEKEASDLTKLSTTELLTYLRQQQPPIEGEVVNEEESVFG